MVGEEICGKSGVGGGSCTNLGTDGGVEKRFVALVKCTGVKYPISLAFESSDASPSWVESVKGNW